MTLGVSHRLRRSARLGGAEQERQSCGSMSECRGEETNENFALALAKHGVMWHTWVRSKTEGGGGDFGRRGRVSRATGHGLDGS
jgi:hypothetical protein